MNMSNTADDNGFIERRENLRIPMALRVSVYYDRLGLLTCKSCNLSIEGMLLDTGRVRLSKHTNVEIVMSDRTEHYSDPIRLQARVSRVNDNLAALTFHNLEVSSFRRLKTLMAGVPGSR